GVGASAQPLYELVTPGVMVGTKQGYYQQFPDGHLHDPVTRWRKSVYGLKTYKASLDWYVHVDVPMEPYYVALQAYYSDVFKLLLTLFLAGLVVAFLLAKSFSRSVRELASITATLPDAMQTSPGKIAWPKMFVLELNQ